MLLPCQLLRALRTWPCTWGSSPWRSASRCCSLWWCWCTGGRRRGWTLTWPTPPSSPLASSPWAPSPPSQVRGHHADLQAAVRYPPLRPPVRPSLFPSVCARLSVSLCPSVCARLSVSLCPSVCAYPSVSLCPSVCARSVSESVPVCLCAIRQ